jgi:hypothetical protein
MSTVTAPGAMVIMTAGRRSEATPARLTTTLYDLMAMLQNVVNPKDDALVVATVAHLLQSGRLTWPGKSMCVPVSSTERYRTTTSVSRQGTICMHP